MPANLNEDFQPPYRPVDFFAHSNWHRMLDEKCYLTIDKQRQIWHVHARLTAFNGLLCANAGK